MKKVILSIISAFLSMLFLGVPAAAITPDYFASQSIVVCSGVQASCGSYTMSPGDTVQYAVNLELPDEAALICIKPDSVLNFVSAGDLAVDDNEGKPFFTASLSYTTTDGYFYNLEEMPHGGKGSFTYVLSLTDSPAVGEVGMACDVSVLDADGNILSSSESPRVYSLYMSISTVDTRLPKSETTSKKEPVVTTYNGQYVGEGAFTLYTDKEMRHPVSFLEDFREFTVCPDGTDMSTQALATDLGGYLTVKGLRSGTYYLCESEAPVDYYKATSGPIVITLDLEENDKGELKMTMTQTPMEQDDNEVVLLRDETRSSTVLLDYKDASSSLVKALLRKPAAVITMVIIVAILAGVRYTAFTAFGKKKSDT